MNNALCPVMYSSKSVKVCARGNLINDSCFKAIVFVEGGRREFTEFPRALSKVELV